ncbi:MAG: hypothetical protein ACLQFT_10100 [Steroidobacteraceae bacterium]
MKKQNSKPEVLSPTPARIIVPTSQPLASRSLRTKAAIGLASLLSLAVPIRAQTTTEVNVLRNTVGDRIETATILSGDVGITGASYSEGHEADIKLDKFGGEGTIGVPQQLGTLPIGWQPRLQGEMGWVSATQNFTAADLYGGQSLTGAQSRFKDFSIAFGGGARFWFTNHFSISPTIMGMYGHTNNTFDPNGNLWAQSQQQNAKDLGLVDYTVDTWTIRPAADFQYVYTWRRTIFTLTSTPTYFHTESFKSSNPNVSVNGDSETWLNKIDVDVPLSMELWGHELRTGGFISRTELYGDIRNGLNIDHLYEVHGRLVLDYLKQFWKAQWFGVGGSYLWGPNGLSGFSIGVDVSFQF